MKNIKLALSSLVATLLLAVQPNLAAAEKSMTNVSGATGIAINGYDPVAFFTESKPVHGDPGIQAKHEGATYLFSSEANKKSFEKSPSKYAPQFGGYCAYGIAVGALFPIEVETWQVIDGKLYFNLNPQIVEAFKADTKGNIAKAEKNWPGILKK